MSDSELVFALQERIEELEAELQALAVGNIERWERECTLANENEKLQAKVRDAHYEGYMAGMGDSEDYDHDPVVMEKEAWAEYKDEEE